jgi:hypothetical protein
MVLRQIKKISDNEAAALRNAAEKIKFLSSIKDSAFLCNDLLEDTSNLKAFSKEEIRASKEIGQYGGPKYKIRFPHPSLALDNVWTRKMPKYEIHFSPPPDTLYSRSNLLEGENNKLHFCISQPGGISAYFNENIPCVCIRTAKDKNDENVFFNGLYYPEKRDRKRLNAAPEKNNILVLAGFFYCRKELYKKIYKVLVSNREEFERVSNRFFVGDLIKLFSASCNSQKTITFKIPSENESEMFIKNAVHGKDEIFLGRMIFYPKNKKYKNVRPEGNVGNIWLNSKNKLIIDIHIDQIKFGIQKEDILNIKRYKKFTRFQNRTNDWAKQIVSIANFAYDIYEQVKEKILIDSI